jgi:aldehyde dehydrogenase (NAD+)
MSEARRLFALQQANRWRIAASTAEQRASKLRRLRDVIFDNRQRVYEAMWADFRKSQAEVDLTEIQTTLIELNDARANLARWIKPRVAKTPLLLTGTRSEVRYEPKGVVLIMAPWNYPFQLLLSPMIAAVAAGNCAILRPSEKVPKTAAVLAHIVRESFDEAEVACVTETGVDMANELITMPFDHVFFTGSIPVGRKVMTAAAANLASVTLELGGKSPLVVDETADIAKTTERAMWGKFLNAGQTCLAPDYALVHIDILALFVEAAKRKIAEFYGKTEDVRKSSPDLARIIDDSGFQRLSSLLEEAVAAGARVEIGGVTNPGERYIAPTLLTNVGWDSRIMREEIFGPILPVLTYEALEEVPDRINALGKPLALYVFSRRPENVEAVVRRTSSGGVVINNVVIHFSNPNIPFGGVGESGQGSYHGWYGFRTFSHERTVMKQGRIGFWNNLYPPYGPKMRRILDVVNKFFL